jgi:micrococcal nuclease
MNARQVFLNLQRGGRQKRTVAEQEHRNAKRWQRMLFLSCLPSVIATALIPAIAFSHGARLDEYGCHAAGKEKGYHCHQGLLAGRTFASRTEMLVARMDSYTSYPPQQAIERFSGQVVSVSAGDRITVLHSGRQKQIRLQGVVSPQKGEPYAKQAKRFTWFMVSNRDVIVTVLARDASGHILGDVTLPDGRILSREIIREGLGRWNRKSRDKSLGDIEAISRAEKRGLWADSQLEPPLDRILR